LKLRIDFLSLDDAAALQDAIAWADSSPLNPDALQTLMTVRGHAFGDLNGAIRLGWQSLRRIPGSALVRNSLAFYLALDGQSAEAWRMLKDAEGNKFPLFYATQGLVAFGRGDVDEGLESYDKAINTVRRSSSDQRQILEFEQLARVYEWVALSRFGLYGGEMKERCPFELPSDWKQDLHYLQVHRLAVSLGLTWPTQFED
jgi:tetratricopeptide (TPR) repeat protein